MPPLAVPEPSFFSSSNSKAAIRLSYFPQTGYCVKVTGFHVKYPFSKYAAIV